jgi:hypothetical protein
MSVNKSKTTGRIIILAAVQPADEGQYCTEPKMTSQSLPQRNAREGTKAEFCALARQFIQGDCMAAEKTKGDLRPLCYEHHVEMKSVRLEKSTNPFTTYSLAYVCPISGCVICFARGTGYFAAEGGGGDQTKPAEVLRVSCPQDEQPMYLAEVHPQKTSLRLWRCGKANCQGHSTIEEFILEPNDPFVQQYLRTNR